MTTRTRLNPSVSGSDSPNSDLEAELDEIHRSITNLTIVLQGEQVRAGTNEQVAAAERERLDKMVGQVASERRKGEHVLQSVQNIRASHTGLEMFAQETRDRLIGLEKTEALAHVRFDNIQSSLDDMRTKLEFLDSTATRTIVRLDNTVHDLHQAEINLKGEMVAFRTLEEKVFIDGEKLSSLMEQCAETRADLDKTVKSLLTPAIGRATVECARLDAVSARTAALEAAADAATREVTDLIAASENARKEHHQLDCRLNQITDNAASLEGCVLEVSREQLDDVRSQIDHLTECSMRMDKTVRQLRAEVKDSLSSTVGSHKRVDKVVEAVASLHWKHDGTSGEVEDVRELLQVPRRRQQSEQGSLSSPEDKPFLC